jgi:hypothetical protein
MKRFLSVLLLALVCILPATAQKGVPASELPTNRVEPHTQLAAHVFDAVTLLYRQDDSGGMHMLCTATAYRKLATSYRFVSASHCVSGETDDEQGETHFFVTADTNGKGQEFYSSQVD